jgi:hypothetical protein
VEVKKAIEDSLPSPRSTAWRCSGYWFARVPTAFWSLLPLMILTLFVKIPYDNWKRSHKCLGLVLVFGTIHILTIESTRGRPVAVLQNPLLRYYMLGLAALGVISFCYKRSGRHLPEHQAKGLEGDADLVGNVPLPAGTVCCRARCSMARSARSALPPRSRAALGERGQLCSIRCNRSTDAPAAQERVVRAEGKGLPLPNSGERARGGRNP